MPKMTLRRIVVEGCGSFPIDMLRYDSAWPATSESVSLLASRDKRQITLHSYASPTAARWLSFGWRVVSEEKIT